MLHRLWLSVRRDHRIYWRNHYYTVTVAVAILYLVAILFLIPASATVRPMIYLVDQTAGGRVAAVLQARGTGGRLQPVADPDELRAAMLRQRNSVGLVLRDATPGAAGTPDTALPQVTLYFQGHEHPRVRNLLAVSVEDLLRRLYQQPWPEPVPIATERLGSAAGLGDVPFNHMFLPLLLFTDAAMIGLLFIAAAMFAENEDRTLAAYMVTPGRVWEYLLSKALALAFLAELFTVLLVPPVLGAGPNYPALLALMALCSLMTSLAGAWLTHYFANLTTFLFPAILAIQVFALPAVSFMAPSFAPLWLRLLPTYAVVFGLREALWPTGDPRVIWHALGILVLASAALLALATRALRHQVART